MMPSSTGILVAAAYGVNPTHQMTEEALADRQAALYGDGGTDESFKVDIPAKQPTDKVRSARLTASCSLQPLSPSSHHHVTSFRHGHTSSSISAQPVVGLLLV